MTDDWTTFGKVRAREAGATLEIVVDGLTTQAKYYKPLIYEFMRKEWRGARPSWLSGSGRWSAATARGNGGGIAP